MATRKKARKKPGPARTVMTAANCRKIAKLIEEKGIHAETAARSLGIATSTMRNHRKRHSDFAAAIDQAEARLEASVVDVIASAAAGGEIKAAQWLAERRWPTRWARPADQVTFNSVVNIDAEAIAKAIHEGLAIVARRHADFSQPDVDAPDGLPTNVPSIPEPQPSRTNEDRP